jgi:transcriptional regulator with XRE-family HTH domain
LKTEAIHRIGRLSVALDSGVDRQTPTPDLRSLLAERGYTLAAAERRAELAAGSLSRRLRGRRGYGLTLDVALRLSRATGIPLETIAEAFTVSLAQGEERRRCIAEVERVRLEAELR